MLKNSLFCAKMWNILGYHYAHIRAKRRTHVVCVKLLSAWLGPNSITRTSPRRLRDKSETSRWLLSGVNFCEVREMEFSPHSGIWWLKSHVLLWFHGRCLTTNAVGLRDTESVVCAARSENTCTVHSIRQRWQTTRERTGWKVSQNFSVLLTL